MILMVNDKVDSREEREETNRRRRLQREKARRREEKGEKARASLQRGRSENNNEPTRFREEESETVNEEEEGGCSHCRGSAATECVYLCQKGHLHRDLPGEVVASNIPHQQQFYPFSNLKKRVKLAISLAAPQQTNHKTKPMFYN